MLTPADDFPVHQTPEPIALSIGERNFYDRYFFNGYSEDGETFFAIAMGFYPQLGVVDAAFSVQREGVQHNVRASKTVESVDRMDLSVGPISIQVEVPLRVLKVQVDHEIVQASLEFNARCPGVLEPRFTRRQQGRVFMDYTRMTQSGSWSGEIAIEGQSKSAHGLMGTRDRSWGLRPVGAPDSQPAAVERQFFWIWAPINFENFSTLYHLNADAAGTPWNESGVVVPLLTQQDTGENQIKPSRSATSSLKLDPKTRRLEAMTVSLAPRVGDPDGPPMVLQLTPHTTFFMSGLGYTHPEWGHGRSHGPLEVGYDQIDLDTVAEEEMPFRHIQALCKVTIDGTDEVGHGVIEQLFLGAYEPLGL